MGYDVIRKEIGLKPLFSFKNIIKPEYRKLFKKDNTNLKDMFKINEIRRQTYINFVQNTLQIFVFGSMKMWDRDFGRHRAPQVYVDANTEFVTG